MRDFQIVFILLSFIVFCFILYLQQIYISNGSTNMQRYTAKRLGTYCQYNKECASNKCDKICII
jgi:hypothetical protein